DAATRISALTHGDPAAGAGCAMYHHLLQVALAGDDPLGALDDALGLVPSELRDPWAERLRPDYDPRRDPIKNGAVWPTLASAVWALRTTSSFEDALRAAIDLGGDTDTVACVTGGLAGAVYSIGAIPTRWTTYVHGELIGRGDSGFDLAGLQRLARDLVAGRRGAPSGPPVE